MTLKMSAESWKLENDLCRCCHSEGTHKNLSEPCLEGEEEIYSTMLQETLDIRIAPVSGPLGTVTYTICEVCIMRLQDAWSFKQQVLQCETRFNDLYTRNVIKMEPDSVIINVKEEAIDSDNEGFKEERLANDSDEDFSMAFDDGNKSDESDMGIQEETKKGKPKPKAKPKAKAPRAAAKKKPVARSVKADAASSETQSEPKEKKDATLTPEDLSEFTVVEEGTQKTYHCNKCDKIATTPASMKNHIRYLHLNSISDTEKTTMCRVPEEVPKKCLTSQKVRNSLVDEYVAQTVTGGKFTCKACELAYSRLSDLRYHVIRSHLKQKFIRCPHCPETFMYHSQRKEHISSTHSKEKPDKFVCANCDRQFKRKNTLAEHMMDVHIEKKCRHCNLRFVRKKYLFHLNEKHGVSMPTCGVCGLRTLMQSSLVRHQRNVHLNEKNKKCQLCSKMFYTQSNLQDHMITHQQNRIFRCDVCAKAFARRGCLKTHCRIHTGEKPFSCSFCAVSFVQRASLRFHIRSHHSGSIQSNKQRK
ncbi:hypothetical protein ABMA28_013040 [Loxostege sticticalis]|uniref:Uncharacterized protein n=1 Tax=Loxostege sticticalis TaxID=481309 RepID=A0ABD0S3L4_LOXSC